MALAARNPMCTVAPEVRCSLVPAAVLCVQRRESLGLPPGDTDPFFELNPLPDGNNDGDFQVRRLLSMATRLEGSIPKELRVYASL